MTFFSVCLSVCLSVSDFVLTFKYRVTPKKGKTEEDIKKSSENRKRKRDAYIENLKQRGLEFEEQDPKVTVPCGGVT